MFTSPNVSQCDNFHNCLVTNYMYIIYIYWLTSLANFKKACSAYVKILNLFKFSFKKLVDLAWIDILHVNLVKLPYRVMH